MYERVVVEGNMCVYALVDYNIIAVYSNLISIKEKAEYVLGESETMLFHHTLVNNMMVSLEDDLWTMTKAI